MSRKMKVFSGTIYKGGVYCCILATYTKKKACEILKLSMNELNNYWYCWEADDKGQPNLVKVKAQALAQPEIPLYCKDNQRYNMDTIYKKWEEIDKST